MRMRIDPDTTTCFTPVNYISMYNPWMRCQHRVPLAIYLTTSNLFASRFWWAHLSFRSICEQNELAEVQAYSVLGLQILLGMFGSILYMHH